MVILRPETSGDVEAIHAVHRAAFPSVDEARLVDALRSAGRLTISVVAVLDGRVIGHVAFSPVTTGDGRFGLGLGPIAVRPEHQRRGIGSQLIRNGLDAARERNCAFVVVLGDPVYYNRFGFQPAPQYGLTDEYGGGDAFRVIAIHPEGIPHGAGLVRYAPEFALVAETP